MDIIERIKMCDTIPELDKMRLEVIREMHKGNFTDIQKSFIKQQNKLRRIPLDKRNW